jgi:hypothetical protein
LVLIFMTIWGNIVEYTDNYVNVDGKKYQSNKSISTDTYTLDTTSKGNVRIELDNEGKVTQMFFYGIDMPEAIANYYKKNR